MDKQQFKAIYDFSNEVGLTPPQLLSQLKELRVVEKSTTLRDLDKYCKDSSYQAMINFLRSSY